MTINTVHEYFYLRYSEDSFIFIYGFQQILCFDKEYRCRNTQQFLTCRCLNYYVFILQSVIIISVFLLTKNHNNWVEQVLNFIQILVSCIYTATEFLGALGFQRGNTHTAAIPLLWNLMGSHDTPRLLHLCGGDRERHHLAAAIQLLSPGMPMIYYGDEVGMTGDRDPDCRRGMLWDRSRWNEPTWEYYQQLLRIRREHPALTEGALVRQDAWDDLALVRITRELDGKKMTVIFHAAENTVELPDLAGQQDLISGEIFSGSLSGFRAMVFRA